MSQSQLLKKVLAVLESSGTPSMLTGSFASSMQGEPRLTHDIDLVVAIESQGTAALLAEFRSPDYYLDEQAAAEAIRSGSMFSLLDIGAGDKVDFWLLTDDPFDQARFARRRAERFEDIILHVSSPEDTILMKLRWAEMSGGSEKQMADVRGVFHQQSEGLDLTYIERWASRLGVAHLWESVRMSADSHH
jgi:hypothetical protein